MVHALAGRLVDSADSVGGGADDMGRLAIRVPRAQTGDGAGDGPLRVAHRGRRCRLRGAGLEGFGGAILAAHVFFNIAVVVRTVGALWSRIDPDLHDAGRVLGAREWKVFRTVTLPLLRPAIAAAAAIVFLFTFTSFGVVLILGGFRFATLEVEIYRQAVTLFDLPSAGAGHRAVGRGDWGPLRLLPLSGASHVDLGPPPRRTGPNRGEGRVSWSQAVSSAP